MIARSLFSQRFWTRFNTIKNAAITVNNVVNRYTIGELLNKWLTNVNKISVMANG